MKLSRRRYLLMVCMVVIASIQAMELPVIHRAPKEDWHDFFGYKIASPIGISARATTDSKGIWLAARSGYDVLTYKTIRCYEHNAHPAPNIRYIQRSLPLTYDDIGKTVIVCNNKPENLSEVALANSFGNPSMDSEWTRNDIKKAKQSLLEGQVLIVSTFGNVVDEWVQAAQLAVDSGADIIEANFSCPNLNTHNEPMYTRPDDIFVIAQNIVKKVPAHIPVIIKCGVFTDVVLMKSALIAAAKAGAKGIVGINSVPMKVVNADGLSAFGTRNMAGVSGAPIRQLALDFIQKAAAIIHKENLNLILLGVGGIIMPSHFSQFLKSGAAVALTATGMMSNPCLAAQYHEQALVKQTHKEKLAHTLFDIGVIKFGDFTFKSGIRSNNYVDMRLAMSHPDILHKLTHCLNDIKQECHADILCPVPYAAVPVTTMLSMISGTPMIMARQQAKDHGTKKMVEGVYTQGQECLIIEDVVTTGSSVLETVKVVEAAGLKVTDIIGIIDRQQGGKENITSKGYNFHALFTLQELLRLLKKSNRVTQETYDMVGASQIKKIIPQESVQKNQILSYRQRAAYCANPIAQHLCAIMETKKTNLVFSADVTSQEKLLELADIIGHQICILKIHCDAIDDYDPDFTLQLRMLAEKHNFLIWEDRKFADIGSITLQQYRGGNFRIADWADIITVHSIAGDGTIQALTSTPETKNAAIFLIAQMSSAGALTQESYAQETVKLALQYPHNVIGLICREKLSDNPGLLHVTPGVQLTQGRDAFGQQYLTPEKVINELGSDMIVVGRGILQAQDSLAAAQRYRKAGWDAYQQRTRVSKL